MSYPYTFKINNVDYSSVIQEYGYATSYDPIYGDSMTSLNGIEYTAVLRYRGTLTLKIKPLEGTTLATLTSALSAGILEITYTCLQRNLDVTASMRLDTNSAELLLKNTSHKWLGNTQLTFTQL